MRHLVLVLIIFSACDRPCPPLYFESLTSYRIAPVTILNSGLKIDNGPFTINLLSLNNRVESIVACLLSKMQVVQNKMEWNCLFSTENRLATFSLSCVTIKIVEPVFSLCSSEQFVRACEGCPPLAAPEALCLEKGVTPTSDCPCLWRTALQNDYVIITPPTLYLWELGRIITSCNDIWHSDYASCLSF